MRQLITTPSQASEILRGPRKTRRASQHELATTLGISQSRLSILEGVSRTFIDGRVDVRERRRRR